MILLNTLQMTFVILVPIILIIVLALLIYKPIMKFYNHKHYKNFYYKKIYKTTLYGDYFLINNFLFFHQDNKTTTIDHLMLGEKYIYIIKDYCYKGSIKGKGNDTSLILLKDDKNNTRQYIDNPIVESKVIVDRLSMVTNIDKSMMVGIVIVNDECSIDVELNDNRFYVVQASNFDKLIKAIESRNIAPINQEELQTVVKDLDRLNRKGKRHVKENM